MEGGPPPSGSHGVANACQDHPRSLPMAPGPRSRAGYRTVRSVGREAPGKPFRRRAPAARPPSGATAANPSPCRTCAVLTGTGETSVGPDHPGYTERPPKPSLAVSEGHCPALEGRSVCSGRVGGNGRAKAKLTHNEVMSAVRSLRTGKPHLPHPCVRAGTPSIGPDATRSRSQCARPWCLVVERCPSSPSGGTAVVLTTEYRRLADPAQHPIAVWNSRASGRVAIRIATHGMGPIGIPKP